MRPYCFLLASLLGLACAPHVAHADAPCGDSDDDDDVARATAHAAAHAHAHAQSWHGTNASTTLDEVRDAKPNGQLDIHAFAGSVHVTGWAQNQLKVHATVSGDCHVEIEPS